MGLQMGAFPGSGSLLASAAAWLLVLLLPGALAVRILFRRRRLPATLLAPLAFTAGSALLLLPAMLVPFTPAGQRRFDGLSLGILCALVVAALWFERRRPTPERPEEPRCGVARAEGLLLGCALLAAGSLLALTILSASEYPASDAWRQAAWIARAGDTPLEESRGGWLPLVARLSQWSGTEPVHELASHLPVLLLPLSLLAFYAFAAELFQSRKLALFASVVQALFLLDTVESGTGAGAAFFLRASEPRTVAWLVVLPVSLHFFLRHLRAREPGSRTGFALSAVALGLLHPVALLYLVVSLLGFAVFRLPSRREPGAAGAFALALLFSAVLLAALWRPAALSDPTATNRQGERSTAGQEIQTGQDVMSPSPVEAARQHFRRLGGAALRAEFFTPLTILSLACLPLLLFYLHKDDAAPFLLGTSVLPPLLALTPAAGPLVGTWLTPREVWDIAWLMPAGLLTAYALAKLGTAASPFLLSSPRPERAARWERLAPPVTLGVLFLLLAGEVNAGYLTLATVRAAAVDPRERELLAFVRRAIPRRAAVIAEPELLMHFRAVQASFEEPPSAARFFSRGFLDRRLSRFIALERQQLYICLRAGDAWERHLNAFGSHFQEVFRNEGWVVLRPRRTFSRKTLESRLAAQQEAAAARPADADGWASLGDMHRAIGQTIKAREAYLRGEQCPGGYAPRTGLRVALSAVEMGEWDLALRAYGAAQRTGPLPPVALLGLAQARMQTGDAAAARDLIEQARRAAPRLLTATRHADLGKAYFTLGERDRAGREFAAALRLEPFDPDLPLRIAGFLAKEHARRDGARYLKEALRRESDNPQTWATIAYNATLRQDWTEAEAAWRECLVLAPGKPRAYLELGELYARRWETGKAVRVLERARTLFPEDSKVGLLLARLTRMRDFERAGG